MISVSFSRDECGEASGLEGRRSVLTGGKDWIISFAVARRMVG
jgi:hypothetical protein